MPRFERLTDRYGRLLAPIVPIPGRPVMVMRVPQYPHNQGFERAVCMGEVAPGENPEDALRVAISMEQVGTRHDKGPPRDPYQYMFLAR